MIEYYMQKVAETSLIRNKLGGLDDFLRCLLDKNADGVGCNVWWRRIIESYLVVYKYLSPYLVFKSVTSMHLFCCDAFPRVSYQAWDITIDFRTLVCTYIYIYMQDMFNVFL